MPPTRSSRGVRLIRFGEFELDVRAAELCKGGQKIRLQEQPFRILVMLLERPGDVVLREDIRKRLWPNGTIVEVGHGINAAVLRLREALGESAENPRYIETLARRGYRFTGQVFGEIPQPQIGSTPTFDSSDLSGKLVSHYQVLEKLGGGGMGVVYRAQDQKLGRYVALKFLPLELAGDPAALGRFQREARAASSLNHPNICTIHGVEEYAGQPFIVMELLEGETLEARLAKGPLPLDTALGLAIQIAGALDAAHRKSVAHRDLKPGNVLLTKSGPKVLDFGLAKMDRVAGGGLASGHDTREGAILGTLHYMSPEQVQGKAAGAASDIFSFGLVMYEMLAGQRAFGGQNSALVIAAILTAEPPVLADAAFPAGLGRVLRRCLAKDTEERWQSARDLKAALEWIAAGETAAWAPQPAAPPPATAAARPAGSFRIRRFTGAASDNLGRRNWMALGAFVGVALAALIPVAVPHWRDWREPAPSRPVTRFTVAAPGGGNITRLRLSPDGRSLAFVAGGRIHIRSFDSLEARVLEGTEGAGSPFWSPDGRSLAFPAAGKLKVIDIAGGIPRVLAEVNTVVAGAWGPDGTLLIGVVGDGLFRVSAAGGPLTRLTQLDRAHNESRHLLPEFLPGGRKFLFTAGAVRAGESVLYAGSLDSLKRSAIMPVESNVTFAASTGDGLRGYLVFTRGNVLMARPFDAGQLRTEGDPFPIVESVGSVPALGAAVTIADFSAAGGALAYRPAIPRQGQPIRFDPPGGPIGTLLPAADAGSITVIQNWMAGVRR